MPNLALFDIDSDVTDRGFNATFGATHLLKLRSSSGVSSVQFQVWDPAAYSSALGIEKNPPFKSKSAPLVQLTGTSTNYLVSPTTLLGTVQMPMPTFGFGSWNVRCIVNGGFLPNGRINPDWVWERMVSLRGNFVRAPIATERQQYETDGIAGLIDDLMLGVQGEPLYFLTTNNTTNIGRTYTVPTRTFAEIKARWVAKDQTLTDRLIKQGTLRVFRDTTASLTIVSAYVDDFTPVATDGTWVGDLNISGADVRQRYQGDVTNQVKWILQMWVTPTPIFFP